jgi:hypothetical protein
MGWADEHIAKLKRGETVSFRPTGNSMSPLIESGQLCTVSPVSPVDVQVYDVVLCELATGQYLHLVNRTLLESINGFSFQIANNRGRINGWVGADQIFGRLTKVEP